MREPTVAAGYAKALLDFAISRGADETRLLAGAGICAEDLRDRDDRLPFVRYIALMRGAKALTGDPALALEFGAATDCDRISIVGLVARVSATMAEGFVQLNRYSRLAAEVDLPGDGPRYEVAHENGACWVIDRRADPNAFPEITETTFTRYITRPRRDFPQFTFALAAEVTHPEPAYRGVYDRLWRIPITFGAARNAIQCTPDWWDKPLNPESGYVFGVLMQHGDALLEKLEKQKTVRGRVESLILPLLHAGEVGIETIAKKMGTSRQTLYRNLKAEGVTFAQVLNDLRRRMALHYLAGERVSVNEAAYLVGFSDPSAFSRAFKRWTGRSPREAKK